VCIPFANAFQRPLIPFFLVCRAFAVRHGYPSPVFLFDFSISFSDLFHFSSPPSSGGGFRASSPVYVFFLFPGAFGPFSV
jgi:hypothetical protein